MLKKDIIIEQHVVPHDAAGRYLSDYCIESITTLPSKKAVKKAIKKGLVLLNGRSAHTGTRIAAGETVVLFRQEDGRPVYEKKLEVVYSDSHVAVVIKPAGLRVNGNLFRTFENALPWNLSVSSASDALSRPLPVHRLDSGTSGLVLVARTGAALARLGLMFEKRQIKKKYRAVVAGFVEKSGFIDVPLDGREAMTDYEPIFSVSSFRHGALTLMDLYPVTGRTHQIRRHCEQMGHPLVGDKIYPGPFIPLKGKGLFLAAVGLSFIHPLTGKNVSLDIAEPDKFRRYMAREERRFIDRNDDR